MRTDHLTEAPVVNARMLIRRPVGEVFQAFVDPEITTRFWFTKSSGRLEPGAEVTWTWEMYCVSTLVTVHEVVENERIVVEWDSDAPTRIDWRFQPTEDGHTIVRITESGYHGTADEAVGRAIDSMGGFTMVLAAAKALLEHDIVLTVVADAHPAGGPE
ncbi:SRPBCC family protein [Actinosynnema sp. NPDC023587]|uniref:SRPBCC family protein n=1 Tax=Actinosynnema sp. NPDC023587 TaxID=3154695 RepID=UPI0034066960